MTMLAGGRGAVRRRLARAMPRRQAGAPRHRQRAVAVIAGVSTAFVVGGWIGALAGAAVAFAAGQLARRLQPPAGLAEMRRSGDELPLALDLLAAALRSGAPPDAAAAAVSDAIGGPLGDRLGHVARALQLGADPAEAWQHLGPLAGADRLARAAVRSSTSGAAAAGSLARLADDLRADRAVAVEAAATACRRAAGVAAGAVLSAGLCAR